MTHPHSEKLIEDFGKCRQCGGPMEKQKTRGPMRCMGCRREYARAECRRNRVRGRFNSKSNKS